MLVSKTCGTVLLGAAFSLLLTATASAQVSVPDADAVTAEVDDLTSGTETTSVPPVVTDPVAEIVKPAVKQVATTVNGTVKVVENTVGDVTGTDAPETAVTKTERDPRSAPDRTRRARAGSPRAATADLRSTPALDGFARPLSFEADAVTVAEVSSTRRSFFDRAAQAALEAVKQLAFPMALALMAGAFLVLQGRVGRKDPKLAVAPVDGENYLRFE